MKLRIVLAGKIKEDNFNSIIEEYLKRISSHCQVEFFDLKVSEDCELNDKDAQKLLGYGRDFYKIALNINGKAFSSEKFAVFFNETLNNRKNVVFYIGGAFGLGKDFTEKCDMSISLSLLTMAHKVAAVVLMEQLYRAITIIGGHPYHK
ncbi:MAG: 23S rRNA (pseudouridine(1915)-N(3))-methyltransferase RlmH [Calditerrivibrio sp.]|nr:23S rRNA (pseudouridine(1915)-N(3))-methyltransferase RlmH [Calditerrivibrio sp.]MCA1980862.1 23S rRNA (pseudouridine(1915)-N(3))-methyltransferase RlmH [Calditerrivibrio sp.]